LMADYLPRVKVSLLAYSLLPTEFRMVVHQNEEYAISEYMQKICSKYAHSTNRRRKRSGPLFHGRFKIEEFKDRDSLLRLSHSIHWSPVTDGLVHDPLDWRFSSAKFYISAQRDNGFLTVDPLLSTVGGTEYYLRFLREYDPSQPGSTGTYHRLQEIGV
jgi:putative transposase